MKMFIYTLLTKISAAQIEDTLSYHRVRGPQLLAIIFTVSIVDNVSGVLYHIWWIRTNDAIKTKIKPH